MPLRIITVCLFSLYALNGKATENYDALFYSGFPTIQKLDTKNKDLRSNFDISKDHYGRLLLATYDGLVWYDGFTSRRIINSEGENVGGVNEIERVISAGPSGIWLLTKTGKVSFFDHQTTTEHKDLTRGKFKASHIELVSDTTLVVASEKQLYLMSYKNQSIQLALLTELPSSEIVLDIDTHENHVFLASQSNLYAINLNLPAKPLINLGYTGSITANILATSKNHLWFFNGKQLLRFNGKTIDRSTVTCGNGRLLQSFDGNIWVASSECGVYVVDSSDGKIVRKFAKTGDPRLSMDTDTVRAIYEDETGTIWLGRYLKGLAFIGPNRVAFSNIINSNWKEKRLLENTVYFVLRHSSGDLWVAHAKGGLSILNAAGEKKRFISTTNQKETLKHPSEQSISHAHLPSRPIYSLVEGNNGIVYAALRNLGVYEIDPSNYLVKRLSKGPPSPEIRYYNLVLSQNNTMYASGKKGAFQLNLKTGIATALTDERGNKFSEKTDHSLSDNDGNVWFAAPNHIAVLAKGKKKRLKILWNKDFPNPEQGKIVNIFKGRGSRILVIAGSSLLKASYLRGTDTIKLTTIANNLPHKSRGRFFENDNNELFTSHELFDLNEVTHYSFTDADGLLPAMYLYYAQLHLNENTLIQGTPSGLVIFRHKNVSKWTFDTPIVLAEVKIDNKPYQGKTETITVPAKANNLTIVAAALDYSAPKLLRYSYRIKGYQNDWIESDYTGRTITLSNLPYGEHTLEIRARNRVGQFGSETKIVNITVLPDWYETLWLRLSIVLLLIGVLWSIYQLRVSQLKHRQRQLEATVADRTQHLNKSLDELKETKDQLVESEKQASLGRLIRGVSHELNTPLGVLKSSISLIETSAADTEQSLQDGGLTQDSLSKFLTNVRKNHSLMHKNVDRMSLLTERFKQSSVEEQQGELCRFDIAPLLQACMKSLSKDISALNIKVDIDCPSELCLLSYPTVLKSAILELFSNSMAHGFDASNPEHNTKKIITIKVRPWNKTDLKIVFSDNGQGMNASTLTEIFEPFFTSSSESERIGLGLHSAYNWIHQSLKGRILCRSKPNSGTTFVLLLKNQGNLNLHTAKT